MYRPCENQELLDFKDYLKDILLQLIEAMFKYEEENSSEKFALKNLRQKIEMMQRKEEWTFDEIDLEFKNLNYYLTVLDTLHLTECEFDDLEIVQQISIDKRHLVFGNIKWSEMKYKNILSKRISLHSDFDSIYKQLRMTYSKIDLEKWFWGKFVFSN